MPTSHLFQLKLSVVVPVYNESRTVLRVLDELLKADDGSGFEIVVVDDGSTDGTRAMLATVADPRVRVILHDTNMGKGAAVLTGRAAATGTHLLVFDADSEYDAKDIPGLLEPIRRGRAEVVYGVRRRGVHATMPTLVHVLGNQVMTLATNLLYGTAITDLHTCLKLVPTRLLNELTVSETGFGLDTEITAELLRRGFRPYEIPVSYVGRSREDGKKIGLKDAFRCFYVLFKVRLRGNTSHGARNKMLIPQPCTCVVC
jgi:glycosyltransferase involved in cell wall biosynthesis